MKDIYKQTAEVIANHPKSSTVLVAFMTYLNTWWFDYGEWFFKMMTSVLGVLVLFLVVIKHSIDIYKEATKKDN